MRYTTIVEKSEDTLNLIIDKANEFEQERVLHAINMRKFCVEEIQMLTAHVCEYHSKLKKEIMALLHFSQDFNKQYATDNNKCFDTAGRLFNRIRSSISGTKKVYKKFCPRTHRHGPVKDGVEQRPSVFTHSMLCTQEYARSLFGVSSYHECVEELCHEMDGFFRDLVVGLKLCRDVMQQEKAIRNDYPTVLGIYEDCCRKVVNESRALIQLWGQSNDIKDDEMTQKKSTATSLQNFVCESFHTVDKSQFQMHAMVDAIKRGRRNGLTELESLMWNNNYEFVMQVRRAISRFDDIDPRGQMDRRERVHKLSAKYVAMFMKWCGITGKGMEKRFVEEYFNKTYKGNYKCIGSSGVNIAKNKFDDHEYKEFCELMSVITSDGYQSAKEIG